jgi:hypothetical protein
MNPSPIVTSRYSAFIVDDHSAIASDRMRIVGDSDTNVTVKDTNGCVDVYSLADENGATHMNTPSHMLINAAVGKKLEQRGIRPMYWALVIGSFMPDIPLTVMSIGLVGWHAIGPGTLSIAEAADMAFYDKFYFDPVWITGHHLFHAPLLIALWMSIGWYFGFRQNRTWGKWIFWFALGNALHTALDIPTHYDDGPLLLFPFNWDLRFMSPVSYWDPARYGREFSVFAVIVDLMLIVYFIGEWRKRRQRHKAKDQPRKIAVGAAQAGD